MYWKFNDCWPVVSWSSIDYLGNWIALHYQVKRSFEDILISVEEKEKTYDIYFINDLLNDFEDRSKVELLSFDGQVLWSIDAANNLEANSSKKHFEIEKSDFTKFDLSKAVLKISFNNNARKAEKLFYFNKPKDLNLPKPNIQIRKISPMEIEISTDVLAKDVYLMGNAHFSDNFFDLLPKTSRRIILSDSLEKIEVMSLWNAMKE